MLPTHDTTYRTPLGWRERLLFGLMIVAWGLLGIIIGALAFGFAAAAAPIAGIRGWRLLRLRAGAAVSSGPTAIEGRYVVLTETVDRGEGARDV